MDDHGDRTYIAKKCREGGPVGAVRVEEDDPKGPETQDIDLVGGRHTQAC